MHDGAMLAEPVDPARAHLAATGPAEVVRDRTWATTVRIPTADGPVWLKACSAGHGTFAPELLPRYAELQRDVPPPAALPDQTVGLPATVQHDDLHHENAFVDGERHRIIDWGDASRSHPFVSLVVTFRFLEERSGLGRAFDLCERIGRFAHVFGWLSQPLLSGRRRPRYDVPLAVVLRCALAAA